MPYVVNLVDFSPRMFVLRGASAYDLAGATVASAGDINGDGLDDYIIGAPSDQNRGTGPGKAYVLFGKTTGFAPIDLSALAPSDGFVIHGDHVQDLTGYGIASAGDVNGDGYDDLIVGSPSSGGASVGMAHVIFGKAGGFANIDLLGMSPTDGFVLKGAGGTELLGYSVASAGDVNRDGFDDLVIGAPINGAGGEQAGGAYVVFGKAGGFGPVDLATLAPGDGFFIQGDLAFDFAGFRVSSAGDFNGDGFDDLIVAAYGGDAGGEDAGQAYLIYGKAGGFGRIDLSNLPTSAGFMIQGDAADDGLGHGVAAAGDVNGDGLADIIVGAPEGDDGGANSGEAYVLFGRSGLSGTIDLTNLTAGSGFIIQGSNGEGLGRSVAGAGDVNGDGYADLIVGATQARYAGTASGAAYIVYGKANPAFRIDVATLSPADGFLMHGDKSRQFTGNGVSSAGDINGDGFADVVIGAYVADGPGGTCAGQAHVVLGLAPTGSITRTGTVASQTLAGGSGDDRLDGLDGDDRLYGNDGDDELNGGAHHDWLSGGSGNDVLSGGSGNDVLDGGGNADRMTGGSGDDVYVVDDADDLVVEAGGGGTDEVRTTLAEYTLSANVERLTGTATDHGQRLTGNALANTVVGTAMNDVILLQHGGADTARAGAGNDGIYMGASLGVGDMIDGGAGNDQVGLQGNYATGVTFGAGTLTGVEVLVLMSGADARFGDTAGNSYSYNLTTHDANVAAGDRLAISFNMLRSGENVTFNGAAETDGSFLTYGGGGTDQLTGGQRDDGFFFGTARWGAGDRVDGQGGGLDQLGFQGDYAGANAIRFGANQIAGIEAIVLLSGADARFGGAGAGFSYDLTMHDGNVAAGGTLTISANRLAATERLSFDATAETNGAYRIFSGAGDDVIIGGVGNDDIWAAGGADRIVGGGGGDTLRGGEGNDVFAYLSIADSTATRQDRIVDFVAGDRIDLSALDADSHVAGKQTFSFIGTAAFNGTAGQLQAAFANGTWTIAADIDGDGAADLSILVDAPATHLWGATDFIL